MPPDRARVGELFHAAVDVPADERRAFLEEACGDDTALLAEVTSLLDSHERAERAGGFLDQPPVAPVSALLPGEPRDLPREIGPYLIEAELGRGGMGVVYLARDRRLGGRRIALKAIPPEHADDAQRRERLRREAHAAASLTHPGVAVVHALEEIDGAVYIASEFVEGRTLRAELEQGPMAPGRLIPIVLRVAEALAAAHAKGIVHRDLKPENIMVSPADAVKILDFGIARLTHAHAAPASRLTDKGVLVGTPGYYAPEQLDGQEADARSDIFAFGILCYEASSGTHPFSSDARVRGYDPPPPSRLNHRVPPAFDRVVRRCLEKSPDRRYQSADEIAVDLRRLEPVVHDRGTLSYHALWRFHQAAVMAVYVALVYPAWVAAEAAGAWWATGAFFGLIAAGVANGTLRIHLLFTERFNASAIGAELRRVSAWLRRSDFAYTAFVLALAGPIAHTRAPLAGILAAAGVASAATAYLVEPATTRTAFGRKAVSGSRRTPPGGTRRTPPGGTRRTPSHTP